MKQVAYYKGCLASLSAKELDSSTRALAPKVGYELVELESVTCCGAGDIHEAEPDYYLHLNARILSYAAATGCDTLMTVCNVCTLNLRQANHQLLNDPALREAYEAACLAGMGLVQVPVPGLSPLVAQGLLVEVLPQYQAPPMPVSLIYAHRRQLPQRVQVFMNWLAEVMRPHLLPWD